MFLIQLLPAPLQRESNRATQSTVGPDVMQIASGDSFVFKDKQNGS